MAIVPKPLEVVLYEAPVWSKGQPPRNPLRGFIQQAVTLLEQPTATAIAQFLRLPVGVVELVLGNLQQVGGVTCDPAGRWSVPPGAPRFESSHDQPAMQRRTRRLLCYWPEADMLLPVLPRLRLRDLVELGVHKLHDELVDYYKRIASWSEAEGIRRGKSATVQLLPLTDAYKPIDGSAGYSASDYVTIDDVFVSRCQLDVIAICWATYSLGVWEIGCRLWSRPTSTTEGRGTPFAPGEYFRYGMPLVEKLLGDDILLTHLGKLFDPHSEDWRELLDQQKTPPGLQRLLSTKAQALIVLDQVDAEHGSQWLDLDTPFARNARLLCFREYSVQSTAKR
ncbi:MAG: hypothetical protein NZU63_01205 [Gemmataceae bacterium]|nr:hypothetical protein [Gemmataceae bacterium]MDW8244540.1 hypothetical protein [Thermogemmata sp.]